MSLLYLYRYGVATHILYIIEHQAVIKHLRSRSPQIFTSLHIADVDQGKVILLFHLIYHSASCSRCSRALGFVVADMPKHMLLQVTRNDIDFYTRLR